MTLCRNFLDQVPKSYQGSDIMCKQLERVVILLDEIGCPAEAELSSSNYCLIVIKPKKKMTGRVQLKSCRSKKKKNRIY